MQAQMLDGDGFMGFSMYSRMYLLTLGIWTGRAMCLQKALLFSFIPDFWFLGKHFYKYTQCNRVPTVN